MHYIKLAVLNTSQAEPTANMQYLMNEPVSMMDWGLLNIDKSIESNGGLKKYGNTITSYDWDKNRILIIVSSIGASSKEQAKEWCRDIVSFIRGFLGVDEKNGKPVFKNNQSFLYRYFTHEGFKRNAEPKELGKELDNITTIQATIFFDGSSTPVKCEAPLLGTSIMFED
jgi:hypothetical protein